MDITDAKGEKPGAEYTPEVEPRLPISDSIPDSYNMDHEYRGQALIVNNVVFKLEDLKPRTGSYVDADNLEVIFNKMGFVTKVEENCTAQQIRELMIKYGKKTEHKDSDCFVCAILSHGQNDGSVYGTDGNEVDIEDIVVPFNGLNCPGLIEKPKIFFIQACRGQKLSKGVDVTQDDSKTEHDASVIDTNAVTRTLPAESDFLMAYSVAPGYYSWRNSTEGSWYIQSLTKVLKEKWQDMDLMSMMTLVCKRVAYDYESQCQNKEMSGKKQIPYIASMLTRKVFFKPKTSQTTEGKST